MVALEDGCVGFDGDGRWAGGDGSLELSNGIGENVGVSGGLDLTFGLVVSAGSLSGGVWVGSLEFLTVGVEVVESVRLPSTLATVGGGVAINDFLLGKGEESSGLDEVGTLNGGGGRESPAGTALFLVLDWVHGTLGSPVDFNIVGFWKDLDVFLRLDTSVAEESLVLFLGPGGELVVSNGEGVVGVGVDLSNFSILLGEDVHSEGVLFRGSV